MITVDTALPVLRDALNGYDGSGFLALGPTQIRALQEIVEAHETQLRATDRRADALALLAIADNDPVAYAAACAPTLT